MLVLITPVGPSMLMFLYSTSASATFKRIQNCRKRSTLTAACAPCGTKQLLTNLDDGYGTLGIVYSTAYSEACGYHLFTLFLMW